VLTNRAGETDFVKVLDFGIAARTESADAQKEAKLTQQGMVLGTPPYMSPEQFTGKALDARSDIYSLSVMAYEMLTGKLPFDAETPWQWATQHMTAQPIPFEVSAPSKSVPEGMRRAILKGLSKDREQREASAREFFTDLSDGGRMTVEANPAETAAAARTGTAAMDAVPAFASGPGPGAPPLHPPHPATPMAVAAAAPAPPARTQSGSGGGKGLIFGLAGVGAMLLAAIIILVVRSNKPVDDTLPVIPLPTSAAAGSAPRTVELPPDTPTPAETTPTPTAEPTTDRPVAGTAGKPATPTPTSKPTPPTTPAAPAGGGCDSCKAAAQSGNASGVVAAMSRCTDEAKKAECKAMLQRTAGGAVRLAANNGQCDRAKVLVQAAASLGIKSAANGLKGTSCQ
jgi:eukaryotic-like serine/threonine-protein kinase